jgi:hypothetical protein
VSHISPLKKLFRRQKALAGLNAMLERRRNENASQVLVLHRPLYFMISQRDFEQHGDAIAKVIDETWGSEQP